jgi:hypothetical protein
LTRKAKSRHRGKKTHVVVRHLSSTLSSILLGSLLPLASLLPLPNVLQELDTVSLNALSLLRDILIPELPDEPLEDMADLALEMVLVVVRPAEESRDKSGKVRSNIGGGEGDDDDFDETEGRLDDLSVVGGDEDGEGGDEVVDHRARNGVCGVGMTGSEHNDIERGGAEGGWKTDP